MWFKYINQMFNDIILWCWNYLALPKNYEILELSKFSFLTIFPFSAMEVSNSYPTSFGQVPVLVIFVLKCLLFKNFYLLLQL